MFDVENTHICSSKMVFEVCKSYMLMLLIKGKKLLEILHHFLTFTQARGSKGGVQLQGGILKGIFKHNKAENERCFDEEYLEISLASVLIYISL